MFRFGSDLLFVLALFAPVALVACGGPGDETPQTSRDSQEPRSTGAIEPESADEAGDSPPSAGATADTGHMLGEPLTEPERYYGLYANPAAPNRQWFVTEAKRPEEAEQAPEVPPGYLAIGAMFGDVAPWHMRTLSETEFEQAWVSDFQPEPVTVEFELGGDGTAVAMTFTNEQYASEGRLERQGDLPEALQ